MRAWLALFVFACGGKVDSGDGGGGDAGSSNDVEVQPDVTLCKFGSGESAVGSDGSCSASQEYTCGSTLYSIACNCPKAACFCTTGSESTTVLTTLMCPTCDVMGNIDQLAALYKFPAP